VRTRSILSDIYASIKNLTGGRIQPYEEAIEQCVNEAFAELQKEYPKVKNCKLMTTEMLKGASEIVVYGEVE